MSLSDAPVVTVMLRTPYDIADEILGGTVSFCRETGYEQNIRMLTFLWSGFLLSSRDQLDEHDLIGRILSCYIHSLSKLFPNLRTDRQMEEQINEMLLHYWNTLSTDFKSLHSVPEISAYLQIANQINHQFSGRASAYLLIADPCQPFAKVASALRSSIYHLLHGFDNDLGIQYRGILNEIRHENTPQPFHSTTPAVQPQFQNVSPRGTTFRKKSNGSFLQRVLICFAYLLFVFLAIWINDHIEDRPSAQDSTLTAVPEPLSGTILSGEPGHDYSKIIIHASAGSSYVVKLKSPSGTTRLSFYVRSGETVTVRVPPECLYVYFASGSTWYGTDYLFGSKTYYSMDDELFDFRGKQLELEYTLVPVVNGNFSATPISSEDF